MGCTSSKILSRSASLKEEFQKRLQRRKTESYEEIFISKNGTDQFLAFFCSSMPDTAATKLEGHEFSSEASTTPKEELKDIVFAEKAVEEVQEPQNNIETVNVWELLAGIEDDNEAAVEEEEEEDTSKSINQLKDDSEDHEISPVVEKMNESRSAKGWKRKMVAEELAWMKVPAFEFTRTGSLRDWLLQGGQVFSPGSYETPRFGSFEPSADGGGEGEEDDCFDPSTVLQLEEAMKEMTMEEEKIIRQIG